MNVGKNAKGKNCYKKIAYDNMANEFKKNRSNSSTQVFHPICAFVFSLFFVCDNECTFMWLLCFSTIIAEIFEQTKLINLV